MRVDLPEFWESFQINIETDCITDLWHEHDVRQADTVAKAVIRSLNHFFDRVESFLNPVAVPCVRVLHMQIGFQVFEDAGIIERMNFARDVLGERPNDRPLVGIRGKQRGIWARLLEVFDDGERLAKNMRIDVQGGDQFARVRLGVFSVLVSAGADIDWHGLIVEPLQIQGNPHPPRRGATKETVKFDSITHGASSFWITDGGGDSLQTVYLPDKMIARHDGPDACRGSGIDQVARLQVIVPGKMAHKFRDIPNEVRQTGVLFDRIPNL
jgi:hypothetical protein